MKLTTPQKIGASIAVAIAGFFAFTKFGNNTNSGADPNTNTNNTNTGNGGNGSTKPKITPQQAIDLAYQVKYATNVILKGTAYANMQKVLDLGIKEGAQVNYANYAGIMMVSSGKNVNLRDKPGTSGTSLKQVQTNEGIGKTTGIFIKNGAYVWAEIIPIPAIVRPIPYAAVSKVYVALAYMKSNSVINNLSGIKVSKLGTLTRGN